MEVERCLRELVLLYKIQQELKVKGLGERSHGSLKNGFTSSEDLGIFLDLILKEEFWEPLGPLYRQYEGKTFHKLQIAMQYIFHYLAYISIYCIYKNQIVFHE